MLVLHIFGSHIERERVAETLRVAALNKTPPLATSEHDRDLDPAVNALRVAVTVRNRDDVDVLLRPFTSVDIAATLYAADGSETLGARYGDGRRIIPWTAVSPAAETVALVASGPGGDLKAFADATRFDREGDDLRGGAFGDVAVTGMFWNVAPGAAFVSFVAVSAPHGKLATANLARAFPKLTLVAVIFFANRPDPQCATFAGGVLIRDWTSDQREVSAATESLSVFGAPGNAGRR